MSTDRLFPAAIAVLAVLILAYSVLILQQILVGIIAASVPVLGYFLWRKLR